MSPPAFFPADRPFVSPETYDAFFAVMDRLEVVVAHETRLLARHDHGELVEAARQKRQGLMELERIVRALRGTIPSQAIADRLARFTDRLQANQAALGVELEAAEAVAGIVTRAMREAESDGTYSRAHGRAAAYQFS